MGNWILEKIEVYKMILRERSKNIFSKEFSQKYLRNRKKISEKKNKFKSSHQINSKS